MLLRNNVIKLIDSFVAYLIGIELIHAMHVGFEYVMHAVKLELYSITKATYYSV